MDELMQAALQSDKPVRVAPTPEAFVAGAVGRLGEALLTALLAGGGYARVHVLTSAPLGSSERRLHGVRGGGLDDPALKLPAVETAWLIYEQDRLANGRDVAFAKLAPAHIEEDAARLAAAGVRHLVLVLPLSLVEQLSNSLLAGSALRLALARLPFERVELLHPATDAGPAPASLIDRLRRFYFSQLRFMLPDSLHPLTSEQIARAAVRIAGEPAAGVQVFGAAELHAALARK